MTINESDFKAAGCYDWNELCDTPETEGKATTLETACPEPISGATELSPPATSLTVTSVSTTDKNPGEVSSSEDQGLLETSPSDVTSSSNLSATTLQWMEAKNPEIHREIRSMMINCGYGIWKCAVCDYAPAKSSNLYNHIECKHLPDHPGYDCDICSRVCKTRHGLICHTQKAHRKGKNPQVTSPGNKTDSSDGGLPTMKDLTFSLMAPDSSSSSSSGNPTGGARRGPEQDNETNGSAAHCQVCERKNSVAVNAKVQICKPCNVFATSQYEKPQLLDCLSGYATPATPCALKFAHKMCRFCRMGKIISLGWDASHARTTGTRIFMRCSECPRMWFETRELLEQHIASHQEARLACDVPHCRKSFLTNHNLSVHQKRAHPRCHFPLCRGLSDHNHLKFLKYSCPENMSSTDVEIYQTSVPQPGSFVCPDHFTTLVLTESGRPLLPEECVAVQQWLSEYRLWKKVPVCDENKSQVSSLKSQVSSLGRRG